LLCGYLFSDISGYFSDVLFYIILISIPVFCLYLNHVLTLCNAFAMWLSQYLAGWLALISGCGLASQRGLAGQLAFPSLTCWLWLKASPERERNRNEIISCGCIQVYINNQ